MNQILIIGQAPALKEQVMPYDTTMLYDWLMEIGLDKAMAVDIFEFEAVFNEFPGLTKSNQHKKPNINQARLHYENTLKSKIEGAKKILILGEVAKSFLPPIYDKPVLFLMHPSRRNYYRYTQNKKETLEALKDFIDQ